MTVVHDPGVRLAAGTTAPPPGTEACMKIIKADVLGMCFGVRDAWSVIDAVERPAEVTIHGELVHNEQVLTRLQARGFHMVGESRRRRCR